MKRNLRKRVHFLILTGVLACSLLGCGGKTGVTEDELPLLIPSSPVADSRNEGIDPTTATVITIPHTTSDELKLYAAKEFDQRYVVNAYGQRMAEYGIDDSGNIINRSGDILIGEPNVKDFCPISRLFFQTNSKTVSLTAGTTLDNAGNSVVTQFAVTTALELSADIIGATNRIVIISSANPSVADVRVNNDAKFLPDGSFTMDYNETALLIPESGKVSLILTAKAAGTSVIYARSLSGSASASATITVQNGEIATATNAPRDASLSSFIIPTDHIHSFTASVVPPTLHEDGYTLYFCSCGYSYRETTIPDDIPDAVHIHSYSAHVIPPTINEQGFTVHACECGDTYRDAFVPSLEP